MCSLLTSYDGPGVRHLIPIKMLRVQIPAFARLPCPLQINIDRCISKFASRHVHQEMGRGIILYMLPRTLNLDTVFE